MISGTIVHPNSDTVEERIKALDELYNFQVEDFRGIYRAMVGLPVTVRYSDSSESKIPI